MAALKLRPVNHGKGRDKNRYCGPSVISALTGMTSGAAAALLRARSGKASIKGTHDHEVLRILEACGVSWTRANPWPVGPTFAQWVKSKPSGTLLIVYGNHWAAVEGRRYVCGITGDVVGFDHPKVKRRARVERVYRLFAPNGVKVPATATVARKADPHAKTRREARKLAAALGVTIEWEGDIKAWFVSHPELLDTDRDPRAGDHYAHGWGEVLEIVRAYAV